MGLQRNVGQAGAWLIAYTGRMHDPAELSFRPLRHVDLPLVFAWLNAPHVRQWWDPPASYEALAEQYAARVAGEDPVRAFLIVHAAHPIGYLQTFRLSGFPEYQKAYGIDEEAAGIDLYIGEEACLHRGLGPHALRLFLSEVVLANSAIVSCIIAPEPENTAAIRAYEKVGFHYVRTVQMPAGDERAYLMCVTRAEHEGTMPIV